MLRVFARAKSRPDCRDALCSILQRLMIASRREPGVLAYEVFETPQGEFLFREEYDTAEAFEVHKRSRHVQVAFARAASLMEGELELWEVAPISEADQRG